MEANDGHEYRQWECENCNGSGMVFIKKMKRYYPNPYEYIFKCSCVSGQKLRFNWPVWDGSGEEMDSEERGRDA